MSKERPDWIQKKVFTDDPVLSIAGRAGARESAKSRAEEKKKAQDRTIEEEAVENYIAENATPNPNDPVVNNEGEVVPRGDLE